MKVSKSTLWAFFIMVVAASLYRVLPNRPFGFAPQVAMALFGGAVIKDKRLAFILPLLSLLISDALYQLLYSLDLTTIQGFYRGQVANYLLFVGLTLFGMLMKKVNVKNVLGFTVSGSIIYFILSNFGVWIGGGGYVRPKTFDGLVQCYWDAITFHRDYGLIKGFYANQLLGDLIFSAIIFGAWFLVNRFSFTPRTQVAR